MDLGCYPVHWLRSLTGAEPTVLTASATLNPLGADETIDATLAFPSGATGRVSASMTVDTFAGRLVVTGERGTATLTNPLHPHLGHSVHITSVTGADHAFTVAGDETYDYQLEAFVTAVRDDAPSLTEGDDIVANMRAIDAIYATAGIGDRGPHTHTKGPDS